MQKVGGQIQSAGQALAPFSALAAATAAGTVTLGVKAAAAGAEIDDLALRLGVSAEKIQEWQYVTAQAGVDWEVFNKALIKGRAALLDLSSGTVNNATKAIQGLGLSLDDFGSQEEMFDGLIDALAGMENKTLQAAYANEIFGDKIANQMLPYLNAGTDAINQFKSEFAQMSPLTNEQVAALAVLDDKIYLLKESLKKVTQQLGAAVMPLVQSIVDALQNKLIPKLQSLAEWFSQLTVGQQKFAMAAMVVVAAIAPLTIGVGKLVSAVGSIIKAIPQLSAALSGLAAHPIILIIAAIAMVLVILYTQCEAFRESINNLVGVLGSALQPVLDVVMSLLNQIMGLLTPILDIIGGILGQIIILSATLANYAKISDLVPYAKTADIAAIGKSGNLADAAQDATHRTVTDVEKAAWNAKQNALTVDTTPTVGSTNPVTSGGVATALAGKADANSVPHASTDLSDGADLVRGSDTVTINGGGV